MTITELYARFEKAEAAYRAVPDTEGKGKEPWERALDKAVGLADRIVRAPANSVAEILLKRRVAIWDIGEKKYERLEELDRWRPTRLSQGAEYHALATLRDDLSRLQAA